MLKIIKKSLKCLKEVDRDNISCVGSLGKTEMFVFNKFVCKFYINSNKIPIEYVLEIDKLILKLV